MKLKRILLGALFVIWGLGACMAMFSVFDPFTGQGVRGHAVVILVVWFIGAIVIGATFPDTPQTRREAWRK